MRPSKTEIRDKSKLQKRADKIAKHFKYAKPTWEELRNLVDLSTVSDLGTVELDILTDMVWARLEEKKKS